jgi:hypothetical protein
MSEGKFKRINRIEIAEKTLERTIGFVNSCDTKASIVLALVGILLTVISTELPTYIVSTKGKDDFQNSVIFMLFIACTVLSFLFIAIATAFLISVLFGRLNSSGNSNIYFGNIKSYNLDDYKKRIKYLTDCNYERDLIEQIYINARICSKKYRKFNISLVFLAIGMVFFIGAIFIEIFAL